MEIQSTWPPVFMCNALSLGSCTDKLELRICFYEQTKWGIKFRKLRVYYTLYRLYSTKTTSNQFPTHHISTACSVVYLQLLFGSVKKTDAWFSKTDGQTVN